MLQSLSIKNFALIESLEINFSSDLSVITGETGSGKSILLGALGLVLGNRADVQSLKDTTSKCVIEAVFEISKYDLNSFFIENDLDFENETTLRREILPSGKSRAFINDSPVTLNVVSQLGAFLIDIHSQHQTRSISEPTYQFEIVDAVADTHLLLKEYAIVLKHFLTEKKELLRLKNQKQDSLKDQEYTTYLLNELQAANLKKGEQEFLEQEFEDLSNVESIKTALEKSVSISLEETVGVSANLLEIKNTITKIAAVSATYQSLSERITSIYLEFEDVNLELQSALDKIVDDPERLEVLNQKIQLIYTLLKKHQVQTVDELCEIRDSLQQQSADLESVDDLIIEKEASIQKKETLLKNITAQIHTLRQKAIPVLVDKIQQLLHRLGMSDAIMEIDLKFTDEFYSNGSDTLSFLFSANKGSAVGLIKKVASGGEMSRIMLAVKAILAEYAHLPTIIFDEIDTGVSGDIANKMGEIMLEMSKFMQVFTITHLPQVAAKGISHYKVSKSSTEADTISELKLLNPEQRIKEIAEMLSGKDITESALIHAKSLLH